MKKYVNPMLHVVSINKQDIIVTSGENENYVKDIPIGRIARIEEIDYDTSLNIQLDPVIDFNRLESVIAIDLKEKAGEQKDD